MYKNKWRYLCKAIASILIIALLCPMFLEILTQKVYAADSIDDLLISSEDVPNFISKHQVEELGHVLRLPNEEDLNTLVYLNQDGTKTKYIIDYPVKYIDKNGNAQFIDLTLIETANDFTTTANDIMLSVSKDYADGVTLTYNDYSVTMVAMPATNSSENISTAPIISASMLNNKITYNDIFGTGIDVKYSPLYNGVKEDIILEEYSGISNFNFLLNTDGLRVYLENNNYYLALNANDDVRIDLGKIIVYDSELKMSEGSMTVTPIKEGQAYQITISVDSSFLEDSDTTYPVRIDPSITVSDITHGANAVTDSPVYSGRPTLNMGTALYNPIGYLDSTYQIGRTAVKLVGLANDSVYQTLAASDIQSAYFYIKDSSGTAAKAVNLYALTSNSTWTETSLTWNTVGTISSTLQATANIGGAAWSSFDITNLVKGWKNNTYNINCGFILQSTNEAVTGNFFSSEGEESNWPYLALTYSIGVNTISVSPASITINTGSTRSLSVTFNPSTAENKQVTWTSSNSSVASVSSSGVVTGIAPGTATITCTSNDSGAKSVCSVTVNPTSYSSLILNSTYSNTLTNGRHFWYQYTPEETGYYMFTSGTSSVDVKAYLFEGSTQVAYDDDSGEGLQFEIRYRLIAGTTYRLRVQGAFAYTTGSFTFSVVECWPEAVAPTIRDRSEWGAAEKITSRLVARTRDPERVIYHHSAEKFSSVDLQECKDEIKRIQTMHMNDKGKCDIAYHFIIDPAGRIWQGAEIDGYQRGHATGYFDDIGVLVLGDFESRLANFWSPNTLNDAQKQAMIEIGKWLCYEYDLPITVTNGPITTHRQVAPSSNPTECPGANMASWVEGELLNTILEWRE